MIREEAKPMFGDMLDIPTQELMRDATPEEQKSIDDYIKSISKPTGVNFWDLADGEYIPKQAVIEQVKDWMNTELRDKTNALHYLEKRLNELPSVDIPSDHDGCKDCKYETYPEYYYPCCECKQNYTDEWQKKPHLIEVDDMIYKCSECGCDDIIGKCNFCHNCGAKMD